MSYLDARITRNEFISTRGARQTQLSAQNSLRLLDYFCKNIHHKNGDEIILELQNAIKKDGKFDRLFRLCNNFVQWLQEDHPDVKVKTNNYVFHIKSHNPSTIQIVLSYLRQYLEEFGQIEFSERRFNRMVKLPRKLHEEPEPITKEEIRAFVESALPKKRALYMMLKDSGMRIGEAVQLRKKDIDLTTIPVTITVQANYTKTKHGRTTFVTRETKPYLERVISILDKDDDLVFGSSQDMRKSVRSQEDTFRRIRERLGFTQKYESNGLYKKNLHAIRAYCATQLAEMYGEEFAHGFIGHKGYLRQYIRNKDKLAEKYLRAENCLMIYETIEVVDQSLTIEQAKKELRQEIQDEFRKDRNELIKLLKNKKVIEELLT